VTAEIWKTYKRKKTEVYDSSKNFKLLWERKKYGCLSKDLWKLPSLYIRHLQFGAFFFIKKKKVKFTREN